MNRIVKLPSVRSFGRLTPDKLTYSADSLEDINYPMEATEE